MEAQADQNIDPRIVQTKTNLKEALVRLVRSNDPAKISVSTLCKEARISRPTFYQHYSSLFDLYGEVVADKLTEVEPDVFASFSISKDPVRGITTIIDYLDEHRDAILATLDTNVMRFGAGKLLRGWLDERLARTFYQAALDDLDPNQADRVTFTANGVLGLMFRRLRDATPRSTSAELAARVTTLLRASMDNVPRPPAASGAAPAEADRAAHADHAAHAAHADAAPADQAPSHT